MDPVTPLPVPTALRHLQPLTFATAQARFLDLLAGRNRSQATIRAYQTDLRQFFAWLEQNNATATEPARVERADVSEYLTHLARRKLSGVSRARKLAALREFFRYLEGEGLLRRSPVAGIETPKKEQGTRTSLRRDEYTQLLALAGANPRDFAILTVFLQTGIRLSELCELRLGDVDLIARRLLVRHGKGMQAREIELERKGIDALKRWLKARPGAAGDWLFLNRYGQRLGHRGVQKLIETYCRKAGLTKRASVHSLRHTFATAKARQGISAPRLQRWLGHRSLNTTQLYIHLAGEGADKEMEASSL